MKLTNQPSSVGATSSEYVAPDGAGSIWFVVLQRCRTYGAGARRATGRTLQPKNINQTELTNKPYKRVFRKSFDESEDLLAKLDYSVAPHFQPAVPIPTDAVASGPATRLPAACPARPSCAATPRCPSINSSAR